MNSKTAAASRPSKSELTRAALMRAAEKVIAEKGLEKVSIRDITSAARQKNESALQYHFKNLKGLVTALHRDRNAQIQARRTELLDELVQASPTPSLRELCELMIAPAFQLARSQPDFRCYIQAFGHELILTDEAALRLTDRKGGSSGRRTGTLLRRALPHLSEDAYRQRMENAVRLASASMYRQARNPQGFDGPPAELFYQRLLDALEGLLSAPESEATRALSARAN